MLNDAFGQPDEADLVDELRSGGYLIASSVAVRDGRVAGHAALSEGAVEDIAVLVLAPVAVAPENQGRGIGTAVVRHVLEAAKGRPVTVLGDPAYYERFGFVSAEEHGLEAPFPTNPGALQVLRGIGAPAGVLEYPKPFRDL